MTTLTHRNIIRDNASQLAYTGATDFNGVRNQEYPLIYNEAGSLVSDAGRNIANIEYDNLNNPVRIQFINGNVTKYVYSAAGEKLRVIYQTAVPNITVAMGSTRELTPSETLYTDSIDYLLGGALTLRNGKIDKYQFDEGYCQAERYTSTKDDFTFCYYDTDHLGNVRQVTELDGSRGGNVIQRNNYYPFGAEFCDNATNYSVQSRKYNGKEFDNMHGLNTYDYGARQYNPVTARWDRMDRYSEKYYSVSPYVYCKDNPVNALDPTGDTLVVLNMGGFIGHSAMLIQQKDKKWAYFSMNGTNVYNKTKGYAGGKPVHDKGEILFNSPKEFLASPYNRKAHSKKDIDDNKVNNYAFSEAIIIPTTPEQDSKAIKCFKEQTKKDYNLLLNNCAQVVSRTLDSIGVKSYRKSYDIDRGSYYNDYPIIPATLFNNLRINYPKYKYIER